MILDSATQLLSAYAPTTNTTPQWNNTYIDMLAKQNVGAGNTLIWFGTVTTTATSNSSATVLHKLEGHATDPTFASGNVLLAQWPLSGTGTAVASVVAGLQFSVKISRNTAIRYIRETITIGVGDLTAGAFSSWITNDDMQDNQPYPAGYSVA